MPRLAERADSAASITYGGRPARSEETASTEGPGSRAEANQHRACSYASIRPLPGSVSVCPRVMVALLHRPSVCVAGIDIPESCSLPGAVPAIQTFRWGVAGGSLSGTSLQFAQRGIHRQRASGPKRVICFESGAV